MSDKGIIWDLAGPQLKPWQAAERLYRAGFRDAEDLTTACAVMYAESGWYLKAWHHNVIRDDDGEPVRVDGRLQIRSTDLGFIQRNVVHSSPVLMLDEDAAGFTAELFADYPDLARADKSAGIAYVLWQKRGWQPWYAHDNESYKKYLGISCLAIGNYMGVLNGLGNSFLSVRGKASVGMTDMPEKIRKLDR